MRCSLTFITITLRRLYHHSTRSAAQSYRNPSNSSTAHDHEIRQWNKRISQLIRHRNLEYARKLFDEMPVRNTVTWNAMMSGYVKCRMVLKARELFDEMKERERDVVSWNLMVSGYVSCKGGGREHVGEGRRLFDRMPVRDSVSWNTMISGYARIGRMGDAIGMFESMPERNVVSWNAIMTGFLQHGDVRSAFEWFMKIPERDAASLSALVSGLIHNGELDQASRILFEHGKVVYDGEEDVVHAYNTLIAGYGQAGQINEARFVFDQIPFTMNRRDLGERRFERNVVSWNTMIMCYVKAGDIVSARELFDQMVERDDISWNTLLTGYVQISDLKQAANLFYCMPYPDTVSWNAMVAGYAKIGNLKLASDLFRKIPQKNIVSWNSIITGYENAEKFRGAIELFIQMQLEGEKPDHHTLSSVLGASAGLAALDFGMQAHQLVTKTLIPDIPINNALVTMYSRCGALNEAMTIFQAVKFCGNPISWNAMIGGYASHGFGLKALELFEAMKWYKVRPTYITFISVLNACAHAGLVEEGRRYFQSMVSDFGIVPRIEHFATLVDVLSRHGQLNEAMNLINGMTQKPNAAIWGALLGSCRMHNNVELARVAADALMVLEPESSAPYVLLYNMYVDAELYEHASEIRDLLERNNVRKEHAASW